MWFRNWAWATKENPPAGGNANRIPFYARKFSFLLDKYCKNDYTLIGVHTEPKLREGMLGFTLRFSDSRDKGTIASLRIYFPFDEIVTIDFSDAGQLMALLRVFKQDDLISMLERFLSTSRQPKEPSNWRLLANEAVD